MNDGTHYVVLFDNPVGIMNDYQFDLNDWFKRSFFISLTLK